MNSIKTCLFLLVAIIVACSPPAEVKPTEPSLKSQFQDDFYIGAALGSTHILQEDSTIAKLVTQQFNTITPENIMKWENIHPERNGYSFELPDKFIKLGQDNDMFTVGHALIWHSQLAPWIEAIEDKDEFQAEIKDHITTIASHFKGRIDAWDVVNEALNEDGTYRESKFYNLLGEDYLKDAFEIAAETDPNAELYYNDYNIEQPAKRKGAIRLIKTIQEAGVKIDGVGIQGHWSINGPPLEDIEQSILEYAALGIKVMFTEVDLTALPNPWDLVGAEVSQNFEGSPYMNPYPTALPDSMQVKLADGYEDLFKLFLKHKDKISRVTFWGVNDGHSWLNGWPIKDRTNYPLLFDRKSEPKEAYHRVMSLK